MKGERNQYDAGGAAPDHSHVAGEPVPEVATEVVTRERREQPRPGSDAGDGDAVVREDLHRDGREDAGERPEDERDPGGDRSRETDFEIPPPCADGADDEGDEEQAEELPDGPHERDRPARNDAGEREREDDEERAGGKRPS